MGWPSWLDEAEQHAVRADTCVGHMRPYRDCKRSHLIRSALRDLWHALTMRDSRR